MPEYSGVLKHKERRFNILRMGQDTPARVNCQFALVTDYQENRLTEKVTSITNSYRQGDDGLFF